MVTSDNFGISWDTSFNIPGSPAIITEYIINANIYSTIACSGNCQYVFLYFFGNYLSQNFGVNWTTIPLPYIIGCRSPNQEISESGKYMISDDCSDSLYISSSYGQNWYIN